MFDALTHGMVLLQSIEVGDITSLSTLKEISLNGLLFIAIYIIWKEKTSLKEELKEERKNIEEYKEKERDKYLDIIVKFQQALDENTRTLKDVAKILDK